MPTADFDGKVSDVYRGDPPPAGAPDALPPLTADERHKAERLVDEWLGDMATGGEAPWSDRSLVARAHLALIAKAGQLQEHIDTECTQLAVAQLKQRAEAAEAERDALRAALGAVLAILDNNNPNSLSHAGYNMDGVVTDMEHDNIDKADLNTCRRVAKQCHDAIDALNKALAAAPAQPAEDAS